MKLCPKCGGELADDGLCGICLLAGGVDTEADPDPTVADAITPAADESHGALEHDSFGPYRILRAIGEGGMGVVYLAEQTHPIRRQVALKVVKPGMDTQQILSRFNYERQALALMDHPNIAHVYDADATEKGRPYFVMEYIDGVPITEYCDRHRLNTAERLELILPICQALQHAHQKGVLHRDIKPSNLLVKEQDGRPVPKIIDFGIAKATGQAIGVDTALTQFGQLVGTLEYISPEQADTVASECDTGSDVYSLGVVIYELLVGAVPFDAASLRKAGLAELLRIIREEEAPSMSAKLSQMGQTATDLAAKRRTDPESLRRQLKDELNWIVMKAVEKNRQRRYQSASELAADIRRHINSEPVLAGPASKLYRARKFAQRHRAAVATAVAFVLVLLVAAGISIRQSRRANREAAVSQAVSDFLMNDLLAQASTASQPGLIAKLDPHLEVRTALDRAAARIAGKFDQQPEVEAAVRQTIGQVYSELGLFPDARTQLERALELHRHALGAEDPRTLRTLMLLGGLAHMQGRFPEAESLFHRTVAIQRRVLGSENQDTLGSMTQLANVYSAEGKYAQAEVLQSQTLDVVRRVLGPEHLLTLSSMSSLANMYFAEGKYTQAQALYGRVLKIRLRVSGPEHQDTLAVMSALANVYSLQGKYAQAEALSSQTLEVLRRVLGPEHPFTLSSTGGLAMVYDMEGKYAQAQALWGQVLEIRRRVLGPEHPDTLAVMGALAVSCMNQGHYAQAEALFSQTLEIMPSVLGAEHLDTLTTAGNLGVVYCNEGKYARAEALLNQTVETLRRVMGPEHPNTLMFMDGLACTYVEQGKYAQGEAMLNNVLEIGGRVLGPEHIYTLMILRDLTSLYQRQGKYALAEVYAARTLAGRRRTLGSGDPETMTAAADLALAYLSQGKFAESETLAQEAVDFGRKKQPDDWRRFRAESLLGASLAGQKKYAEAETLLLGGYQGMAARRDHVGVPDRHHLNRAREWILQLYQSWDKPEKAAAWRKR